MTETKRHLRLYPEYKPSGVEWPGGGGIEGFLRREVLPYAPDAWYVLDSVKTGYEISFTRYFYKPQPLRPLAEIRTDILALERETEGLAGGDYRWVVERDAVIERSLLQGRSNVL